MGLICSRISYLFGNCFIRSRDNDCNTKDRYVSCPSQIPKIPPCQVTKEYCCGDCCGCNDLFNPNCKNKYNNSSHLPRVSTPINIEYPKNKIRPPRPPPYNPDWNVN